MIKPGRGRLYKIGNPSQQPEFSKRNATQCIFFLEICSAVKGFFKKKRMIKSIVVYFALIQ